MNRMKKAMRILVLAMLCAALLCGTAFADTAEYVSSFPDVPGDADYAEAARAMSEMGVFTGDGEGRFNPDKVLSRAEVAVILCSLVGVEVDAESEVASTFSDVSPSHWAFKYISAAVKEGFISGYGNGRFGPDEMVTYEQFISMLIRAWGYGDPAKLEGGYPNGYLAVANKLGIIDSDTKETKAGITRSNVAMICYRATFTVPLNDLI